jgi:hypothetical protein
MTPIRLGGCILALITVASCTNNQQAHPKATSPPSGTSSAATSTSPAARFTASVTNQWFPLQPGSTRTYTGVKDGEPSKDVFVVQRRTQTINGVPCVVVSDQLYLSGELGERTTDYYTQDQDGNVWYFGEDTAELDSAGNVTSTEGSWRAGKDGAQPGIYIDAHPRVGHGDRQEFYRGHAEDHYQVISLSSPVTVPYRSFASSLVTKEWTPLEPGVLDHKYYVAGVGMVAEVSAAGPVERNKLVSFTTG